MRAMTSVTVSVKSTVFRVNRGRKKTQKTTTRKLINKQKSEYLMLIFKLIPAVFLIQFVMTISYVIYHDLIDKVNEAINH